MIQDTSLRELLHKYQTKELSPLDIIDDAYKNIESSSARHNTLISVRDKEEVRSELKKLDPKLPLYGLPYTLKDTYVTTEGTTTAGSKVLDNFRSPYDATVHRKLKEAGALLIGKANLDSWGHGASNENSDYGIAKNPWDTSRVAGGSSGGPAVAVITGMGAFAIGEDTGGSIRLPSSWNNVSGLKVTYGRVSRYGSIAYASSLDTVGPMAKSVEDLALLLGVIAGLDPCDATSSPELVPNYQAMLTTNRRLKIGLAPELLGNGLDPEIKTVIEQASTKLEGLGHELVTISLPIAKLAVADYYIIAPSETSSNLARYDGVRYGGSRALFTEETMRRIMIGTFNLSTGYSDAYYHQALKIRTLLIRVFREAFADCDLILMPVSPTLPSEIGQLLGDPLASMMADLYTTPVSLVGSPSLALPAGFSQSGLPIGMQFVGPKWSESTLLALGFEYQQVTNWHLRRPTL